MPKGVSLWPDGKSTASWYGVAGLWREMEESCRCTIEVTLTSAGTAQAPDLAAHLKVTGLTPDGTGVQPLVSERYLCSAQRLATLEGLYFFLLYQADFLLAAYEMNGGDNPA